MFFLPSGILILLILFLLLPVLFFLAFFHLITLGFEKLGISYSATIAILFLMLIGSAVNIPITKRKFFYAKRRYFFGIFEDTRLVPSGIAVNLGGAVLPVLMSLYFMHKVPLKPVLITTILMTIISNFFARPVRGRGIAIPAFIPPIFSAIFALIFAPHFSAPVAFISGVLGTLIGADILNIKRARKELGPGIISIGGAGVFDGIFLVGIISALLT